MTTDILTKPVHPAEVFKSRVDRLWRRIDLFHAQLLDLDPPSRREIKRLIDLCKADVDLLLHVPDRSSSDADG